jgi:hypothetical protein
MTIDESTNELPTPEIVSNDKYTPVYPEGILPKDEKHDPPTYEGDMNDLIERMRVKLFNVWSVWSDLRKNETLVNLLHKDPEDDVKAKYLKGIMTITMDRLGKMLADTNIVQELNKDKEVLCEETE